MIKRAVRTVRGGGEGDGDHGGDDDIVVGSHCLRVRDEGGAQGRWYSWGLILWLIECMHAFGLKAVFSGLAVGKEVRVFLGFVGGNASFYLYKCGAKTKSFVACFCYF